MTKQSEGSMRSLFKAILFLTMSTAACFPADVAHSALRANDVHSPFRWTFADSAARVGQSVSAADTGKVALQLSDTSTWLLQDNSPKVWKQLGQTLDTLTVRGGVSVGRTLRADSVFTPKLDATQADINGGTLDGVIIGGASAQAATVTTLSADSVAARRARFSTGSAMYTPILWSGDATGKTGALYSDNGGIGLADSVQYNTLLYMNRSNKDLSIFIKGDAKHSFDSSGNVGIGTTSPSAKLHVSGGVQADSIYMGAHGWFKGDTGSFPCTLKASAALHTYSVSAKDTIGRLRYAAYGKVIHCLIDSINVAVTDNGSGFHVYGAVPDQLQFGGTAPMGSFSLGPEASNAVVYTNPTAPKIRIGISNSCQLSNPQFTVYGFE